MITQQIIFTIIFITASLLFAKKIRQLRRNIFLGRKEEACKSFDTGKKNDDKLSQTYIDKYCRKQ